MSTVLAKMAVQISANTAEFNRALTQTSKNLTNFTSGLQSIAGSIGVAFSAKAIADFALDISKLAGEAEGVKAAFDRLENSVQLMIELKKATNGTVSELDLMKRAVMASNFDISLKALPKLLEFATLRAKQTGQSVDYLVDSIVTGIGRKSKLILDNLGISAVQLDEALGGASTAASSIGEVADAVGRIAEQDLKSMAGFTDDAKTSMDQLNASWTNFKISLGDGLNKTGLLQSGAKSLAGTLDVLSNSALGWIEKIKILGSLNGEEKFKKASEAAAELADKQFRLSKWDAQQLINKYGGINGAIEAMNSAALMFENNGGRLIENKTQILGILNQRLKESTDAVTRGLEKETKAAGDTAKAYEEVFKSKANLDFKKGITPNVTNIHSLTKPGKMVAQGEMGISDGLQNQIDGLKDSSAEIKGIQLDLSNATASFVDDMAETIGASISGQMDFGKGFLISLAKFSGMFGKQLIALGFASEALKKTFSNPYVAIAAGTALVIASAAVAGSIGRFNASYGGSGGGSASIGVNRPAVNGVTQNSYEFRIRGKDLVAIAAQAERDNRIRQGG